MAGQDDQAKPISLFYSYSPRTRTFGADLRRISRPRRGDLIAEWHDRKLEPGLDGLDLAAVARQVAVHGRQIALD